MKLSCAIVLTLTNLVIATPFSFSVKGSGTQSKVDPAPSTFGTFGLGQPVGPKTGYSGTFSKSSSANFASSSASENSGSFSYNAAQGTPSVVYNTGTAFEVPGQAVGQNVAVTPQAFPTAVPVIDNTGSSGDTGAPVYYFSKDVNHISAPSKVQTENKPDISLGYNPHAFVSEDISKPNVFTSTGSALDSGISGSLSSQYVSNIPVITNTASNLSPTGQKPGVYLGSTSQVSGTQDSTKPNTLVSGSPAYTGVSDSSDTAELQHQLVGAERKHADCLGNAHTSVSQGISNPNVFATNIVSKQPEAIKEWSAVQGHSSSTVNSGAIASVPTNQEQVTPTVEEKPVYSSGFGGPPGLLSPYDKVSVSGVAISGSNLNQYQQNAELSESVSSPSSYAFQQQQTLAVQPVQSISSGANYFASNAESSYQPDIKPTSQNVNKPVVVNTNQRPSSELKPFKVVQTSVDQNLYQKPVDESPKKPEVSVEYPSQTIKPGYQVYIQAYPSKETSQAGLEYNKGYTSIESDKTVEQSKKPLYTGGFGAPAGVLQPIPTTGSEVHKYASTSFKPEQYEELKPSVGYTPTISRIYKYSNVPGEVKPTEKPYPENASYQSVNVGPSSASSVIVKPTGSISYSEQDTSSFGVSSTAGTVGHISTESGWKVEESKKPLYSGGFGAPAGGLQPIQGYVGEVHKYVSTTFKPEQYEESKPSLGYTTTITKVNKYSTTPGEVKPTEKPNFENASYQSVNVGSSPGSYVTVTPTGSISYSEHDTSSFGVSSTAGTVGHISTEPGWKVEETKKPLYAGGFGTPTGGLQPIQGTVAEVHKYASTTFKPEQYEESKPTVGYTPTITKVNKYSTTSGEVTLREKPYSENASYQSVNVASNPGSYVTFKPTGSISYSEQDTSSSGVSSTAGTGGALEQKVEEQIPSKPYNSNPAKPTFSTWEQNPSQASNYFVQKPIPVEPVKPAVQISSQSKPIFSNTPQTYKTPQLPIYSYPLAGQNPSTQIPGGYKPSSVFVTKDESKPNSQVVTNQYETSQFGAISHQEVEKQFYQAFPTGSTSISSSVASSYKPEQTSVPFDTTKPSSTVVITGQKEIASVSDVKVSSHLSEQSHEKETISPSLGAVNPTVPQNSVVYRNTGFVSVSQEPTNKPSFEKSSEKIPAFAFSGNPLTISHSPIPSISYLEQKETQKPNTYSDKIEAQFPKKPAVTNPDKSSYYSSFGTLTGSTGYKTSSYGQESTVVTGSNDKVSQVNLGIVKPFVKPELSTLSQQTSVSTSSVSQNTDKQKHTDNTFVQNKPTVITSEGKKFTNQAFTTNSGVASGATPFGSKLQYQLPTIQPAVQKNPWHTNSFGSFWTAKPYNKQYPGFTSSVTTYGQALSQDKTKQTTQITSNGQYVPFSSGQYKPYTTGQYKPSNWGFNGQPGYQKYNNIYPTGGTFVSTYAPTTFKPFVTSSQFDKSKTSSIFAVSDNKESTSVSGFGSPFSVTTAKPSLQTQTQTSYKPAQEPTVLGGYYVEKPKVSKVVVPAKPEAPLSKPSETQPKKSYLSLNSESVGISSIDQSSFSAVKPTVNLPAASAQSDINSETTDTVSPTKVFNTNNKSGVTAEVTKLSVTSFAPQPVSQVNPSFQNKPYADVGVGSLLVKPSTPSASQFKIDEQIQSSQPVKPYWSSDLDHKGSSVGVGVTPDNLKPTEQPYLSSTAYFINKEVTPTQVSAIKPSSYDTFITVSANKGDEKFQYSPTSRPEWSTDSKQKGPSLVSVGEASESVKPTGQPLLSTSSYPFNKEETPTQLSVTKPSRYGTVIVDTSSQNKLNKKVEFSQTSTPVWSSLSNQKVTADSSNPNVQPSLGTSFYSINKVVSPTQVDSNKPSSFGTSNTAFSTTTTNVGSVQSVVSSANEENSGVQQSSVEKWSVTPIPVTHKPEYLSSFQQSSGHVLTSSSSVNTESDSTVVSGSEITTKPLSATDNSQNLSYENPNKPVFAKPTAQISTVGKKPALVVTYKEKDTNEASFVSTVFKPTVPSTTDVKVASKYTDGPAKVPTSFIYTTQIPPKNNQQPLGLNSNAGASQTIQASYVGGFGGPPGILNPNDFSSPPQQQYVQTQYKPSYNNQVGWANQQNPPSGVNSNSASYFGGFGSTSGVWTANENAKPNGFDYVQSVNKYTTNVQAQNKVNQDAVFESQASIGGSSNAAGSPSTSESVNNYEIQNPFNGGVSTGTGFTKNNYKLAGQLSGTKTFGTTQFRPSATPGLYGSFL